MGIVQWAEDTARKYLADALPRRWAHVQKVAERAEQFAGTLDAGGDDLRAAAWLHDVGYAPPLAKLKFHPLDGARFLRSAAAPDRLAGLVAYHSAAATEAEVLGLADELAEFTDERTLVRDLLWYADMTVGPSGELLTFPERMAEVRIRYTPDHYVVRALSTSMPQREAAIERAKQWIADQA